MTALWFARAVRRPEAAPVGFLVLAVLALAFTTPGFSAPANLLSIVAQVAVVGVVALALNQVILSGEIDVSVGSALAACAFVYATTANATGSVALSLATAILVGLCVGAVNGLVVSAGRVPSIIATLGMLLALRGGVLLLGANGILTVPQTARVFGLGELAGLRAPILILAAAFGIYAFVGRNLTWGRDILAVGSNARAAAAVGLRAGRVRFLAFLSMGAAVGGASAIFAGQIGQIQATAASGFELQCIAAVVLGGTSITGGRGSTVAPLLGAVLVGVILNALTLNNIPPTFEQLVLGVLILAAIVLDAVRGRAAGRAA